MATDKVRVVNIRSFVYTVRTVDFPYRQLGFYLKTRCTICYRFAISCGCLLYSTLYVAICEVRVLLLQSASINWPTLCKAAHNVQRSVKSL